MSNELAVTNFDELSKIAGAMVKSGYFQDARDVSQAIVKIMAGREMGIGAFQSMQSIYIIQGRPSMSANLMAAKVKASGRYDYRVITLTDHLCEIAFYQEGKELGRSSFSSDEAKKAGTKNMDRYPRNMLFSRAMSNGVRWYCPDVVGSAAVYTPEELGANVDSDGAMVIDAQVIEKPLQNAPVVQQEARTQAQPAQVDENAAAIEVPALDYEKAKTVTNSKGQLYIDIDTPTLSNMANAITRKLAAKDGTPEETDERQYKLAAIRCILVKRAEANVSVK